MFAGTGTFRVDTGWLHEIGWNLIDPETSRVVADGCRSLHDPQGLLSRLCNAVRAQGGYGTYGNQDFRRLEFAPVDQFLRQVREV